MVEIWYKNPYILLENYNDFFPKKRMKNIEKLNALARLAIYYFIIIIILKLDNKWLSISIILLLITYFIGQSENFNNKIECVKPTKENPYMNFTLNDLINNPNRPKACPVDSVRKEQIKMYKSNNVHADANDLWGKYINDRNFYTMPSTEIVNDQTGFAKFVFGDFGKCKSEGIDCLKHRDNKFHRSRFKF